MKTSYFVIPASLLICISTVHAMEEEELSSDTSFAENGNGTHAITLEEFLKTLTGLPQNQIESYCLERLDDTFQHYLEQFKRRPYQERSSAVFSLNNKRLEMYWLPQEDIEQLNKCRSNKKSPSSLSPPYYK